MRRPREQWIERVVRAGRRLWGLDDQWVIEVKPVPVCRVTGSPTPMCIFWESLPQKIATIEIQMSAYDDRQKLCLDLWHELGHLVIGVLWRMATSWFDQKGVYPPNSRQRAALEDTWNDAENVVIDTLLYQAFHARERWKKILRELGRE